VDTQGRETQDRVEAGDGVAKQDTGFTSDREAAFGPSRSHCINYVLQYRTVHTDCTRSIWTLSYLREANRGKFQTRAM
jgi:hypothetical protein